jgi:YfiH family protein
MSRGRLPTIKGPQWNGVKSFCTTRQGGVSLGPWASLNLGFHTGDDPEHVNKNRQRLGTLLPTVPVWLDQVHGVGIVDADRLCPEAFANGAVPPAADAAITRTPGRVLAIMTADCLPVVLAKSDGSALGVVHAGWRGLAAGVLEATLRQLCAGNKAAGTWRAWIGPAISQAHFEVGSDVIDAFAAQDPKALEFFSPQPSRKKWMADLPGLARLRLCQAGVQHVELSDCCTYQQADRFFSYRRDGVTGRQVTIAWLTGD